jgi:TolA-binding protein
MNTPTKIVLYVVLSLATALFGKYFFRDYQRSGQAAAPTEFSGDPMDIEVPTYDQEGNRTILDQEPEPIATEETSEPVQPNLTADTAADETTNPMAADPAGVIEPTPTTTDTASPLPDPRLGFYGGGFCLSLLFLGLLAAADITQYLGKGAIDTLFNDDGVGVTDDEYEVAEAEWQNGDYLEAIRLMRDYLAKNPKQIHAALRIAEIYEKDLNNPLAAALEYEEILEAKLPRERWGWAAIHLANIYSGPLEKPDQAIALLRRLDDEYGDTQAAEKARRRLSMIDGNGEAEEA